MTPPLVRVAAERGGAWQRVHLEAPPGHLLSLAMVHALHEAIAEAGRRPAVKWLTVEGSGGQFSYGASIPEHVPATMPEVLTVTHALMRLVLDLPVATTALVDGRCLGGGFELALCCDAVLATRTATLGLPEIALAAFPPVAAALLPVRIGASRAHQAILGGDARPAVEWHDLGLVSLVPDGSTLEEAARRWFEDTLAPRSAMALAQATLAARAVWRPAVERALVANERRYLDQLLAHPDAEEGIRAWMEKRAPQWRE
ncbi:MAG: enoyl-CoA hydratase/isomerase family protein [Vicinamibacterales bacterium]